jgi:hypothetical protein
MGKLGASKVAVKAVLATGKKKPSKRAKATSEVNLGVKGSEYLQQLAGDYITIEEEEEEPETVNSSESAGSSSSKALGTDADQDCCENMKCGRSQSDRCKRKKRGVVCVHGFCFQCCIETPFPVGGASGYCPGHYAQKLKKEQEDRYIDEGLNRKLRNTCKFYSYEERFTNTQQTVTVWCVSDFYGVKDFSSDILADLANAERRQEALRKRRAHMLGRSATATATTTTTSTSTATSTDSSSSAGKLSPSKRQAPHNSSSSSSSSAGSGKSSEVRSALDNVEHYTAKAWCVLRDEKKKSSQERWQRVQAAWLQQQKKLGVENTAWLLKP